MSDHCQLLYTSFVAPDLERSDVLQIVRRARAKNGRLAISGILLFDGLCFCQYLEGPRNRLDAMLGTLRSDARHVEMVVKDYGPLPDARLFGNSPLAFALCTDPKSLDGIARADSGAALQAFHALLPTLTIDHGH